MFPEILAIPPYDGAETQVGVGRVDAILVEHVAKSSAPIGFEPVNGTAVLTPSVKETRWPNGDPKRFGVLKAHVCPIIDGYLFAPGVTREQAEGSVNPGVVVTATDQPDAIPDKIYWNVSFRLDGGAENPRSFNFEVPDGGFVDLATYMPSGPPQPGTVTIVSTIDRERAEAAATLAEGFADAAEDAAGVAVVATQGLGAPVVTKTWGGAETLNTGAGFVIATLNANSTVTLQPGAVGIAQTLNLIVKQTGAHTLTLPGVKWSQAVAYEVTPEAGAQDFLSLTWDGTAWWGFVAATAGDTP